MPKFKIEVEQMMIASITVEADDMGAALELAAAQDPKSIQWSVIPGGRVDTRITDVDTGEWDVVSDCNPCDA